MGVIVLHGMNRIVFFFLLFITSRAFLLSVKPEPVLEPFGFCVR